MSPLGDRRALPALRRGPGRRLLPALVLLCGLFLAHGIQCSVHSAASHGAGPTAMSAPNAHDAGISGAMGLMTMAVLPVAMDHGPVGDGGGLPVHGLLVCLAILIAVLVVVLATGRTSKVGQVRRRLEDGAALVSRTLQKWRAAVPDLTILCVSRT